MERDFKGVWIPREVWLDDGLSALEKVILIEIDSLDTEENHCYASNKYLAEFCRCSEIKVSQAIKKFIFLGYIEQISFDGRTRILKSRLKDCLRQTYKKYKADLKKISPINKENNIENNIEDIERKNIKKELFEEQFNGVKQSLIPPTKQGTLDTEILDVEKQDLEFQGVEFQGVEKEKSIKKEKDSLLVQEFEIIWARYPRHEGKQNALKSYIKARHEGVDMVTIKDAVESYRRMCESERREKRYIKQGSTWFNQRSWEDEYGTTKTLGAGTSCENSEFDKYDSTEVPF